MGIEDTVMCLQLHGPGVDTYIVCMILIYLTCTMLYILW